MEIIKFMYEHWVLTTWFLFLIGGGRIITFSKRVHNNCKSKKSDW